MQTHFSACFCYNLKGSLKLWSLSHGNPLVYNIYSYQSISICFQVVQYQEQSNLAFLFLIKSQNREEHLDLGELMKFPLLPVPPSLGTQDGFFNKTNKAAVLHYLLEDLSSDDILHIDQPAPNLWRNMPASPGPNGGEEKLHLFHGQLP